MANGTSRSGGGGGASFTGTLNLGGDDSNIQFDGTLKYGKKDPVLKGKNRQAIEAWEGKRAKAKIEYAFATDGDGNPVGREIRGGKGSVRVPISYHNQENGAFTHIHPREAGVLGGTFSNADLYNFANGKSAVTRAVAKEGTYSISKGKNFDQSGFKKFVNDADAKFAKTAKSNIKKASERYRSGKIDYNTYLSEYGKAFNSALVELHNIYLSGQKKYGYNYSLEKR